MTSTWLMKVAQSERMRGSATGPLMLAMMTRRSFSTGESLPAAIARGGPWEGVPVFNAWVNPATRAGLPGNV